MSGPNEKIYKGVNLDSKEGVEVFEDDLGEENFRKKQKQ